jgi:type I restriction enzyme R subunit
MTNNDEANARIAFSAALTDIMVSMFSDETQLVKQYFDNPEFNRWFTDAVFRSTYDQKAG